MQGPREAGARRAEPHSKDGPGANPSANHLKNRGSEKVELGPVTDFKTETREPLLTNVPREDSTAGKKFEEETPSIEGRSREGFLEMSPETALHSGVGDLWAGRLRPCGTGSAGSACLWSTFAAATR